MLRNNEWNGLQQTLLDVAVEYRVLREFASSPKLDLSNGGLSYFSLDTHFVVLKRISAARRR